jgi:hypothetical protein
MTKPVLFFLVVATFSLFEHGHSGEAPRQQHATAALYAGSLLLGIQLGAKQGSAAGTVKSSVANCIMALDASSLTDVVEAVLVKNLTPAELEAADTFFATTAGKKYAQLGASDVYTSVGETAPDMPTVSDAESKEIEDFKNTATSDKLWKVLNGEPARRLYGPRIRALANVCGAGWP